MFMSPMQYLDSEGLQYQVLHHPYAQTIQETAILAQLPEASIAKVAVVSLMSTSIMPSLKEAIVLIPGSCSVDLLALGKELNAENVQLISSSRHELLFGGHELGCEVPFGHLYGLSVYMARELFNRFDIIFKAGDHQTLIRMNTVDFCNLTQIQMIESGYSDRNAKDFYSEQTAKPWRWV